MPDLGVDPFSVSVSAFLKQVAILIRSREKISYYSHLVGVFAAIAGVAYLLYTVRSSVAHVVVLERRIMDHAELEETWEVWGAGFR